MRSTAASSSAASTRRGGGALVHCHAGVSRSCAVIAAHVMKTRGVDADDALEVVRRAHPRADPNAGFVAQLRPVALHGLQAEHGRRGLQALQRRATREAQGVPRVRRRHGRPTRIRASTSTQLDERHSWRRNASDRFVPFVGSASVAIVGPRHGGGREAGSMIRCRRCGRLVARGGNLLPHRPGQGIDAFSWRKRHKMEAAGAGTGSAGGLSEPLHAAHRVDARALRTGFPRRVS